MSCHLLLFHHHHHRHHLLFIENLHSNQSRESSWVHCDIFQHRESFRQQQKKTTKRKQRNKQTVSNSHRFVANMFIRFLVITILLNLCEVSHAGEEKVLCDLVSANPNVDLQWGTACTHATGCLSTACLPCSGSLQHITCSAGLITSL